MHAYPNFFYSINSSLDNVYNAKKKFGIANHYGKIGGKKRSEKSDIFKKIFQEKPNNTWFLF